jgi:altronate dehydratase small subunit
VTRAFCINIADNVATLLDDAREPGIVQILGPAPGREVNSREPIALGHKIAIVEITQGAPITKFGVRIGIASKAILAGEWVHLHNCESGFDERSQTLDLHTGAATDTTYE